MSRASAAATAREVDAFLEGGGFSGYQAMPLPHGREVPGRDRTNLADVFAVDVAGRSVLDVGCYYGRYCYEAVQRGARRVVGLEPDGERWVVARRIADLHGGVYDVRQTRVEDLPAAERYDVVLLLNVLHHLTDPVRVVCRLAAVCDGTMVVEFPPPWDVGCLSATLFPTSRARRLRGLLARAVGALLALLVRRLPVLLVGARPYHQAFYFSPAAFRNVFVVHHRVFTDVRFVRSEAGRWLAFCTVAPAEQAR
jgi:2-polyprenyl-3-methyl-5-hydroxy-6-metoxy-1,4-benzoquinol methylase